MIEALHFKGSWTLADLSARIVVAEQLPTGGVSDSLWFDLDQICRRAPASAALQVEGGPRGEGADLERTPDEGGGEADRGGAGVERR